MLFLRLGVFLAPNTAGPPSPYLVSAFPGKKLERRVFAPSLIVPGWSSSQSWWRNLEKWSRILSLLWGICVSVLTLWGFAPPLRTCWLWWTLSPPLELSCSMCPCVVTHPPAPIPHFSGFLELLTRLCSPFILYTAARIIT